MLKNSNDREIMKKERKYCTFWSNMSENLVDSTSKKVIGETDL